MKQNERWDFILTEHIHEIHFNSDPAMLYIRLGTKQEKNCGFLSRFVQNTVDVHGRVGESVALPGTTLVRWIPVEMKICFDIEIDHLLTF